MGLGIHGEPGAERTKLVPVDKLVPLVRKPHVVVLSTSEQSAGVVQTS